MRKKILKYCLDFARGHNNDHPEWGNFHHFTFIVQSNKVIGFGVNRLGSPPKHLGYASWGKVHSETDAMSKNRAFIDFSLKWEIVNIRLNKLGNTRMARPCNCCHNFLLSLGVHNMWWTTANDWQHLL